MNVISFEGSLHRCCEVKRGHGIRVCYKNGKTRMLRKGAGGDRVRDGLAGNQGHWKPLQLSDQGQTGTDLATTIVDAWLTGEQRW